MTEVPDILGRLRLGVSTGTPAETVELARALAAHIPHDQVLALSGDLGAGKTTFVKGLAKAWGVEETVTSPTFNLYTIYRGSRQLVHLDAYRLGTSAELGALMLEDFLHSPWCLAVEWPERIAEALPESTWRLELETSASDGRHRIRLKN